MYSHTVRHAHDVLCIHALSNYFITVLKSVLSLHTLLVANMLNDEEQMNSFVLSNMAPQHPKHNQGELIYINSDTTCML